jgi:outer membrane protein assembly factor BamB
LPTNGTIGQRRTIDGTITLREFLNDPFAIHLAPLHLGGQLVVLDAETGKVQWQEELGIDVQVPPHVAGDVLYVPTTFVVSGLDSDPEGKATLFAFNAADGSELWQFESDNYILQTPFLQGETVYVAGV